MLALARASLSLSALSVSLTVRTLLLSTRWTLGLAPVHSETLPYSTILPDPSSNRFASESKLLTWSFTKVRFASSKDATGCSITVSSSMLSVTRCTTLIVFRISVGETRHTVALGAFVHSSRAQQVPATPPPTTT